MAAVWATMNVTSTLDYTGKTNPPVMQIYWPQSGDTVTGTAFALRGSLDDFTASLTAQIVDSSGNTNTLQGLVERNGLFWIENTPLLAGTNYVTLTAVDATGTNSTTTNLTVNVCGGVAIDDFSSGLGGNPRNVIPVVTGEISLTNYVLWVNGVQATQDGQGHWQANSVPVGPGGTAVVEARAIPNTEADNNGNGTGTTQTTDGTPGNPTAADSIAAELEIDQPSVVYMQQYNYSYSSYSDYSECQMKRTDTYDGSVNITYGNGGTANAYSFTSMNWGGGPNPVWDEQTFDWPCDQCSITDVETDQTGASNTFTTPLWNVLWTCEMESMFAETMPMAEWAISGQSGYSLLVGGCPVVEVDGGNESICTTMMLYTGGKGVPSAQNLFDLGVSATSYTASTNVDVEDWMPIWEEETVPFAQIQDLEPV